MKRSQTVFLTSISLLRTGTLARLNNPSYRVNQYPATDHVEAPSTRSRNISTDRSSADPIELGLLPSGCATRKSASVVFWKILLNLG
ncbi:hypothetical protein PDE_00822 [Penicillium oxalicum 114-2]|uniref:Secreted protein n=1 Tax=Penicillium oxalicum (strain 114-2 / CGMCC 5302) TaxID=933388 RepID=S7ZB41_PENO1|nr:hypothetical protein PDE_00822 [Penicillium oxalicum 114-2]